MIDWIEKSHYISISPALLVLVDRGEILLLPYGARACSVQEPEIVHFLPASGAGGLVWHLDELLRTVAHHLFSLLFRRLEREHII